MAIQIQPGALPKPHEVLYCWYEDGVAEVVAGPLYLDYTVAWYDEDGRYIQDELLSGAQVTTKLNSMGRIIDARLTDRA